MTHGFVTSAAVAARPSAPPPEDAPLDLTPHPVDARMDCGWALMLLLSMTLPPPVPLTVVAAVVGMAWTTGRARAHNREVLERVRCLVLDARAALPPRHPARQALERYYRLLRGLVRGGPAGSLTWTGRRWALAERLARRCQHFLEHPQLPAPASLNILPPMCPAPMVARPPLPRLVQRSRSRRGVLRSLR